MDFVDADTYPEISCCFMRIVETLEMFTVAQKYFRNARDLSKGFQLQSFNEMEWKAFSIFR